MKRGAAARSSHAAARSQGEVVAGESWGSRRRRGARAGGRRYRCGGRRPQAGSRRRGEGSCRRAVWGRVGRGLVGGGQALFEGVLGSRGCCRGGLKGLLGVVWPWPRAGAERNGRGWGRAQRRCWCWAVNSGRRAGRWQSVAAAPVVFCFGRPPRCAEQQHAPSQPVLH